MKILLLFIYILFSTGCSADNASNTIFSNNLPAGINSEHFSAVLYDSVPGSAAEEILSKLEQNYFRVLNDLSIINDTTHIIVRLWGNEEHFLNDMQRDLGTRYTGATGYVYGKNEIRVLFRSLSSTANDALHEFCHIATIMINKVIANNPRWLWEAAAIYLSGGFVNPSTLTYLKQGLFPSISELNSSYNLGNMKIYQVGYVLAEYTISVFGKEKFIDLIKTNGGFSSSLSITQEQFEAGWKEFVKKKYML